MAIDPDKMARMLAVFDGNPHIEDREIPEDQKIDQRGRDLLIEMIRNFVTTGRRQIPEGRRPEVVAMLLRTLSDPDAMTGLAMAVRECQKAVGPDTRSRMLRMSMLDIPEDQILAEGFVNLPDENLVDIVTSAEALNAIDQLFFGEGCLDHEIGDWFIEAAGVS